jgi:hypothetical protein
MGWMDALSEVLTSLSRLIKDVEGWLALRPRLGTCDAGVAARQEEWRSIARALLSRRAGIKESKGEEEKI